MWFYFIATFDGRVAITKSPTHCDLSACIAIPGRVHTTIVCQKVWRVSNGFGRVRRLCSGGAKRKITDTVADSKSGINLLIFLVAVVKSHAGEKIRLVGDNGRFQHALTLTMCW